MKRLSLFFVLALVISPAFVAVAAQKTAMPHGYKAYLTGAEVPPVATPAKGEVLFELTGKDMKGAGAGGPAGAGKGAGGLNVPEKGPYYKGIPGAQRGSAAGGAANALHFTLAVSDLKDATAAHLHLGKSTTAEGPVVAPLFKGPKSGVFNGTLAQGTITDKDLSGPLKGKSINDLVAMINSGDVYVNVHTKQHPAGEIRGQVKPE